jgi:vitamin B12/bleomycin/antimicrobial peptide transport system ATP-binding/permease protein
MPSSLCEFVPHRCRIQILPVLVVSPLYFAGSIELGVITQSSGAFNSILDDLSLIVNEFEGLSSFSAGLDRLAAFVQRMEAYQAIPTLALGSGEAQLANLTQARGAAAAGPAPEGRVAPRGSRIRNLESEALPAGRALIVDNLSLLTPDGSRMLFANVSLDVIPGEHILVMGNSGTGKSSLLRAVAGLWTRGSGEVVRPLNTDTVFLPQRPYCTHIGSLRQQLVYPKTVDDWAEGGTDDSLLRALQKVQLGGLASSGAAGLDEVRDWGDELSLGEQQRLAFARLLVIQPRLAILDEATSALDLDSEAAMYMCLAALPGITFLSVGHRPSLLRFHTSRLRLFGMERAPSYVVEVITNGTA